MGILETAIKLYKEYNPNKPIKNPKAKLLRPADKNNYGVRWFKKTRFKDILSLVAIDRQAILSKKMLPKGESKMKYFRDVLNSSENHDKYQFYVFALTDIKNEVIGWVQYLPDENTGKIRKLVKLEKKAKVFEVAYAKLFSQNLKGVAVNGLKNTMDIIRKIDNNGSYDLYITGYTESRNIASEYVLNSNRFTKLDSQIVYEGELNNVWVKKIN
jgi:hypothetical protein